MMNFIYHEKQEGALCGQHCINNLLQNDYFTAVELAAIAEEIDNEEQRHMAASGINSADFQKFIEEPSGNMDDSGMFSIQVLTKALQTFGLTLVNYASSHPVALKSQSHPTEQVAYICNFREHWFTIRKLGYQWFNLNSLLSYPELISDTYLSLFLIQLQHEGYCIFVVDGQLPLTNADTALREKPAVQNIKPQLINSERADSSRHREDEELRAALAASLVRHSGVSEPHHSSSHRLQQSQSEKELETALRMSMDQNFEEHFEDDDFKRALALSMEAKVGKPKEGTDEMHELEKALQMSLDSSLLHVDVPENVMEEDVEKIRKKRIEKLDKKT